MGKTQASGERKLPDSRELRNQILVSYGIKSPRCWSRRKGSFEPSRCFGKWFLSFFTAKTPSSEKMDLLGGLAKNRPACAVIRRLTR